MYHIEADYTGAFELPFPFTFMYPVQAIKVCKILNDLRRSVPEWERLKPFNVTRDGRVVFIGD